MKYFVGHDLENLHINSLAATVALDGISIPTAVHANLFVADLPGSHKLHRQIFFLPFLPPPEKKKSQYHQPRFGNYLKADWFDKASQVF